MIDWFVYEGNVFLWVFSLMQCNFVSRYISIGPLGIHSITSEEYYIKVVYDKTKSDQTGDKVTDKNIYDNPFIPLSNGFA